MSTVLRIRLLYFAALRDAVGVSEEELELAPGTTVNALIAKLRSRGGVWAEEFAPLAPIRAAVEQEFVALDAPLSANCEVALFPPVTGG